MPFDITTPRLRLAYVPDVETFDWGSGGRCGVYYIHHEGNGSTYAGAISLTGHSKAHGEIGYEIEPRFRGCGIATEAVGAVVGRAAADHGFTLLSAKARLENIASCRVLEKSGFVLTGAKLCWLDEEDNALGVAKYRLVDGQPGQRP